MDSASRRLTLRTALFTLLVPGAVTVFIPAVLLGGPAAVSRPLHWASTAPALVLLFGGAAWYTRCAVEFVRSGRGTPAPIQPPRRLVIRGLYLRTRNPMYVGVVAVLVGEALLFRSMRLLAYALFVFAMFHAFVVLYEEPHLARTFGEAYVRYRRVVPRWLGPRGAPR